MVEGKIPILTLGKKAYHHCGEKTVEDDTHAYLEHALQKELVLLHRDFRRSQDEESGFMRCAGEGDADHASSAGNRRLKQLSLIKEYIHRDIALLTNNKAQSRIQRTSRAAARLLQTYLDSVEACTEARNKVRDLTTAVDAMMLSLTKIQLKWSRQDAMTWSSAHYETRAFNLENRLYVFTTRFNRICSSISETKKDIESLLILRQQFFAAQNSFRRRLSLTKDQASKLTSKSFTTYEVIEEVRQRIKHLRKLAVEEVSLHHLQMGDQQRIVQNYWKIHKFTMKKNKHRQILESVFSRRTTREAATLQKYSAILKTYRSCFLQILQVFKFTNQARIIEAYHGTEASNLNMMRQNLDAHHEIVGLKESIRSLKVSNRELKSERKLKDDFYRESRNKSGRLLSNKYTIRNQQLSELDTAQVEADIIGKDLKMLYEQVEGRETPSEQLLGQRNTQGIGTFNSMLRVIERRCKELLRREQEMLRVKNKFTGGVQPGLPPGGGHRNLLASVTVPVFSPKSLKGSGGFFAPTFVITSLQEMSVTDDDEDKVLGTKVFTKAELKHYCLSLILLKKREEIMAASGVSRSVTSVGSSALTTGSSAAVHT